MEGESVWYAVPMCKDAWLFWRMTEIITLDLLKKFIVKYVCQRFEGTQLNDRKNL